MIIEILHKNPESLFGFPVKGKVMTNEMIIMNERIRLYDEGKIKGTGRTMEISMEDGTKKNIEEPEPIHTFLRWKEYGYSVKKGEKAIAQLEIWKYTEKKKTDGEDVEEENAEHAFKKKAFFFCFAQVEPIRRKADESEKV